MAVHKITPLTGELADLLRKTSSYNGFKYTDLDGWILPEEYVKYSETIENLEVRDDDVWVCGFPKSGTTWTQEMVWCIANDLDFERGKIAVEKRVPLLEVQSVVLAGAAGTEPADHRFDTLNYIANMPSPRFIATHLPTNLLPRQLRSGEKKPKIIHIRRNPKDICISFCHFLNLLGETIDIEDFYTLFLNDLVSNGPLFKYLLSYWNKRNDYNILFLTYEDMKKVSHRRFAISGEKTAKFLGKYLTNDQVSLLVEHLSFESMKVNPAVNKETIISHGKTMSHIDPDQAAFIRNGTTGQWKDVMPPEIIKQFDDWTHEHLKGSGLSF